MTSILYDSEEHLVSANPLNYLEEMPVIYTFTQTWVNECSTHAANRTLYEAYLKDAIKRDILKKLGMKKPPSRTSQMAPTHLIYQMIFDNSIKFANQSYEHDQIQSDDPGINYVDENNSCNSHPKIINILRKDGTGILPVDVTNGGHEIHFFNMNIRQLEGE